jgi:hypothetical protein
MPTKDIDWTFPVKQGGEWDSFNHSGIETFRADPFTSLAREIIQNSLDVPDVAPITVEFIYHTIRKKDLPGAAALGKVIEKCQAPAKLEGSKAKQFFTNAKKILAGDKIPVLSVHERNTQGMEGPCTRGKPYFAYMKAAGQSVKSSATAGGSYGIGKFAPYAVSALRTMFVSTVYEQRGKGKHHLTQGKTILISHRDRKSDRQGAGYWGQTDESCSPIEGYSPEIPVWLGRLSSAESPAQHLGTSLHIVGFDARKDWDKILAVSVLENFFAAVWFGELEVSIGDIEINKETIAGLFDQKDLKDSVSHMTGQPERFSNAATYLAALASTDSVIETHENRTLGRCRMHILLGEDLPKKVVVLRNGMVITDELDGLKRFSDYKEFVGVVQCESAKGNELLRTMEPPAHNTFEPELLATSKERRQARASLKELAQFVRNSLKRHARDPVAEVTAIDELADYFADEDEAESADRGEEINPVGGISIRAKPLPRKSATKRAEDGGTDDGTGGGKDKGKGKSGQGSGAGASGGQSEKRYIELHNLRAVTTDGRRFSLQHRVSLTPRLTGKMNLVLMESGADSDRPLKIIKASKGTVRNGSISSIAVNDGQRITIELELTEQFGGSFKAMGYEV